jgi:hypothetical protein
VTTPADVPTVNPPDADPRTTGSTADKDDTAIRIAFYNAARAEVVQRITLREQVLFGAVAAYGVICVVALRASEPVPDLILLIPGLAGIFTLVLSRHDRIIQMLGAYVGSAYFDPLRTPARADWDNSDILKVKLQRYLTHERLACMALLVGPGVIILALRLSHTGIDRDLPFDPALFCATLSVLGGAVYFLLKIFRQR